MPEFDNLLDTDRDWLVERAEADYASRQPDGSVIPSGADRIYKLALAEGRSRNRTRPGATARAFAASDLDFGGSASFHDPLAQYAYGGIKSFEALDYVEELQTLYDEHGENVSMDFFLKYDPNDLKFFHKSLGLGMDKSLADVVSKVALVRDARAAQEQEIQSTYEELVGKAQTRINVWNNFWGSLANALIGNGVLRASEQEMTLSEEEHNQLMEDARAIVEERYVEHRAEEIVNKMIAVGDFTFSTNMEGETGYAGELVYSEGNEGLFRRTDKGAFWRDYAQFDGESFWDRVTATWNPYQDDRRVTDEVRAAMIQEVVTRLENGQTEAEIRHGDNWSFRVWDNVADSAVGFLGAAMHLLSYAPVARDPWKDAQDQRSWVDRKKEMVEDFGEYIEGYTLGGVIAEWAEENPDSLLWADEQHVQMQEYLDRWDEEVASKEVKVASYNEAQHQWQDHAMMEDEVYTAYMGIGGSPQAAFELFAASIMPSAEEQLEMVESSRDEVAEQLEALREANGGDFALTAPVLNALAAYGKAVPMTLATAYTAYAADPDWRNDIVYEDLGIYEAVKLKAENENYSPAQAMGLDGTFVGLMTDLGLGMAFDPTTWVFGGSANAGRIATKAQAAKAATTGVGKVWANDVANLAARNADTLVIGRQMLWMGHYGDDAIGKMLRGAPEAEVAEAIMRGSQAAMENGISNPFAGRSALALRAAASLRRAFGRGKGESLAAVEARARRLITPQTTRRTVNTSSPHFYEDVAVIIETTTGLDPTIRDGILRRLLALKEKERVLAVNKHMDETAIRLELDMVEDAIERIKHWDGESALSLEDFDPALREMLEADEAVAGVAMVDDIPQPTVVDELGEASPTQQYLEENPGGVPPEAPVPDEYADLTPEQVEAADWIEARTQQLVNEDYDAMGGLVGDEYEHARVQAEEEWLTKRMEELDPDDFGDDAYLEASRLQAEGELDALRERLNPTPAVDDTLEGGVPGELLQDASELEGSGPPPPGLDEGDIAELTADERPVPKSSRTIEELESRYSEDYFVNQRGPGPGGIEIGADYWAWLRVYEDATGLNEIEILGVPFYAADDPARAIEDLRAAAAISGENWAQGRLKVVTEFFEGLGIPEDQLGKIPDKLYHGTKNPLVGGPVSRRLVQEDGSLIIRVGHQIDGAQNKASLTPSAVTADAFKSHWRNGVVESRRLRQGHIIEIDADAVDLSKLSWRQWDEVRHEGDVVIPAGKWREVELPRNVADQVADKGWQLRNEPWAITGRSGATRLEAEYISGMQEGADRWALEALQERGARVGGYSPERVGLIDEDFAASAGATRFSNPDGPQPNTSGGHYVNRTIANVDEADATVVFMGKGDFSASSGTTGTLHYALTGEWSTAAATKRALTENPQAFGLQEVSRNLYANFDGHRPVVVVIDDLDDAGKAWLKNHLGDQSSARVNFAGPRPGRGRWAVDEYERIVKDTVRSMVDEPAPAARTFEVSTRGNELGKKFSALNARIKGRGNKTIEEIYQTEIKGYKTVREGKGRPPKYSISREQSKAAYDDLWREYLEENPDLAKQLWDETEGGTVELTDMFSREGDVVSQADSLQRILRERFEPNEQQLAARAEAVESMNREARVVFGRNGEGVNVGRSTSGGEVGASSGKSFGNPFRVGADGTLEEVVEKYARWLDGQIAADPAFADDVAGLAGKQLRCPTRSPHSPCHAEVLAKKADELAARPAGPNEQVAAEVAAQREARWAAAQQQVEAKRAAAQRGKSGLVEKLEARADHLRQRKPAPADALDRALFDRAASAQQILDEMVIQIFYKDELWNKVDNLVHEDDLPILQQYSKAMEEWRAKGSVAANKPSLPEQEILIYWDELDWGRASTNLDRNERRRRFLENDFEDKKQWLPTDPHLWDTNAAEGMAMREMDEWWYSNFSQVANRTAAVQMPVSPYMLHAARSGNKALLHRLSKKTVIDSARKGFDVTLKLWMIDKLLGPRTAAVVHFDEMMRIYSRYGIARTMKHQLQGTVARRTRQLKNNLSNLSEGERKLLAVLDDSVPDAARLERSLAEASYPQWQLLQRGDVNSRDFDDAARRVIAGNMSDSGFRAYVKGREEFAEWWRTSEDANTLRVRGYLTFEGPDRVPTKKVPTEQQIFDMYDRVFPILFNGKKNIAGENLRTALRRVAERADENGKVMIPNELLESVDKVMGVPPSRSMSDAFFDKLFADPLQRRRSLIYRLEAELEEARLAALFKSQGKVILPDHEIARRTGISLEDAIGYRERLNEHILQTTNYVPEGHIQRLVDRHANEAMDRMLYGWDSTNAATEGLKHIAPFYGPWEDMWKFWFREIGSRPYVRKNNIVGKVASLGETVNPRPFAMASRLAATDFELDFTEDDKNWANFGLNNVMGAMGISSINAASLIFLPTAGSNPASTMIPQPGLWPMFALDALMEFMGGDDPTEWRQVSQTFSEVFPGAAYSRGNWLSDLTNRTLGGGLLSRATSIGANTAVALNPTNPAGRNAQNVISRFANDWSFHSLAAQSLRSEMASGKIDISQLLTRHGDDLQAEIDALVISAERRAARQDALGNDLFSWLVPASSDTGVITEEVEDIWIEGGRALPSVFGKAPARDASSEEKRRYADSVRNLYFKELTEEQQLMAIIASPNLAINLVSGWEWTDSGRDALGVDALLPYRTGPTNKDRNRHQMYLNDGYIQHIDGAQYVTRVLETVAFAKERLGILLFTTAYQRLNKDMWNSVVSDETKGKMQAALTDGVSIYSKVGVDTPEELWLFLGSLEDEQERNIIFDLMDRGMDEDEANDFYNEWKTNYPYRIPEAEKAMSTSFPEHLNRDTGRIRNPFGGGPLPVNVIMPGGERMLPDWGDQALQLLGITGGNDMTTVSLYNDIKDIKDADAAIKADTSIYTSAVSSSKWVPSTAAANELVAVRDNVSFPQESRELINEFVGANTVWEKRFEYGVQMTNEDRKEMREMFLKVSRQIPNALPMPWESLWETAYARRYGDLDFTPPEPPGLNSANAFQPSEVLRVDDGDTLTIRNKGELWNQRVPMGTVKVRLIGVDSPEMTSEEGIQSRQKLVADLAAARRRGDKITLVMDPDYTGFEADHYGRILAWLYIGNTPYTMGVEGFIPRTGDS